MSKIIFIYMRNKYEMEYNHNEKLINLLNQYANLINTNVEELYFMHKGEHLSLNN